MTYGDGADNASPLTAIDVAAHEMTHGLTSNTAGLVYNAYDSGGLNEATSDILAAAVEFHANHAQDPGDYLAGETLDLNGNGTPLRYLDEPSKDGRSLDYWRSNIGVMNPHYSSGIGNHFFYLLSEGGGSKTVNGVTYFSPTFDNLAVPAIGIAKAEKIWFKALTERMLPNETHPDARTCLGGRERRDPARRPLAGGPFLREPHRLRRQGLPSGHHLADHGHRGRRQRPASVRVSVDVKHPFSGEVTLALVASDGTEYSIKTFEANGARDIQATYGVNASSEVANGTWKLKVQDTYPGTEGFLDSWKITF